MRKQKWVFPIDFDSRPCNRSPLARWLWYISKIDNSAQLKLNTRWPGSWIALNFCLDIQLMTLMLLKDAPAAAASQWLLRPADFSCAGWPEHLPVVIVITAAITVTVTVTEALVLRPLLENRGSITESIRILVPVDRMKQKIFQITTKQVAWSQQFQLRR